MSAVLPPGVLRLGQDEHRRLVISRGLFPTATVPSDSVRRLAFLRDGAYTIFIIGSFPRAPMAGRSSRFRSNGGDCAMRSDIHVNPISPYDLDVIDSVFRAELRKRKLSRCSEEAEQLAAKLISLYQAGRRDAHELAAAVAVAAKATDISVDSSSQQHKSGTSC
ncbi:hypothetical protein CN068_01985 [Sinorhizobium meliloti]|nr:hypothetical protein CN068_01985 [Sinorhizobium meliloti]